MYSIKKETNLSLIIDTGVVAVIRSNNSSEMINIVKSLEKGGIKAIEVTMTVNGAIEAIRDISEKMKDRVLIGTGTVIDEVTAKLSILAGAEFIVSPVYKQEIVTVAKRHSKIVIPGAFTPTEILTAWEAGADAVKVFPATKLGPEFFRDMAGPFPQLRLAPTGGVTLGNVADYIKAGAAFVGVGSSLIDRDIIENKRWEQLEERAVKFIEEVKKARTSIN
ncbi:MAG TPA: bifunctional 4-hydroxy-2-oxoglutarate aldolase/2-dehydro-3-deoxy-phosphogluconate aldolase [Bacillota bacterium]|nr:bifunctional 4-hydroxy-2-oxoglutarate aldolase/2-dehydro-3-deoxy-phosphogluconate aldolase [Bacillota bacterium]HOA15291.1 bifunctional 4-hydroxy-2-oxoglutarate aldolase/2-dehydro-3-deoxy-phosphogluconate aldolase [Bacillota bacterium]